MTLAFNCMIEKERTVGKRVKTVPYSILLAFEPRKGDYEQ